MLKSYVLMLPIIVTQAFAVEADSIEQGQGNMAVMPRVGAM